MPSRLAPDDPAAAAATADTVLLLATDNAATAHADAAICAMYALMNAIGSTTIPRQDLAARVLVFAPTLLYVALTAAAWVWPPPPPPTMTTTRTTMETHAAVHAAWRARRDAGAGALRLLHAATINRAVTGGAPLRLSSSAKTGPHTWGQWAAGRSSPMVVFLLSANARLPPRAAAATAAVQAALLAAAQARACTSVLTTRPATAHFFHAAAVAGRRTAVYAVGALVGGDAPAAVVGGGGGEGAACLPAGQPPHLRSCVVIMTALHCAALAGGTALGGWWAGLGGGRFARQARPLSLVGVAVTAAAAGLAGLAAGDWAWAWRRGWDGCA